MSELARRTGFAASNVHRTLQTWVHLGFVSQDPISGAYQCTLRLFEWGSHVAERFDVRRIARVHLAQLARITQETIHLSVLDGAEIVYLDKIDSPQPVRAYSELGGRAPAHCVATGKALLAYGGPAALDALPDPLPRLTRHTVTNRAALATQVSKILNRGYAVNHEEWRDGVSGLGSPIFDRQGRAVAAVGLSAPSLRMTAARERQLAAALVETTHAITAILTGQPTGQASGNTG